MQHRYDYRRKLPHLQPDCKIFFITFSTSRRWMLPNPARDIVMETCLRGDGHRFELHALVVMPDHVHLALTPKWDERGSFSIREIMQEIKASRHTALAKKQGTLDASGKSSLYDRALRREEDLSVKVKYMLDNPVRAGLVSTPAAYRWIWIDNSELGRTGGAPVPPSKCAV
jgi:putative transposase